MIAALESALSSINASLGLAIDITDLSDLQPVTVEPVRHGDYLVAPGMKAQVWRLARFDHQGWHGDGFTVGHNWVWCGLLTPNPRRRSESFDLQSWARKTLETLRAQTLSALLDLKEKLSDLPVHGGDEVDRSSFHIERESHLRMLDLLERRLSEIEAAFERLREGRYGLCKATGEEIGIERLKVNPLARYTIEHQSRMERQQSLQKKTLTI